MRYRLKQFITVRVTSKHIIFTSRNDETITFQKSTDRVELINKLVNEGLNEASIQEMDDEIRLFLFDQDLLVTEYQKTERGESFFEYLQWKNNEEFDYRKLKNRRILVLGAGGGGSTIIYQLAQLEVSKLTIIDFDKVEVSDLKKSSIFERDQIGKYKVTAIREKIVESAFQTEILPIISKVDEKYIDDILSSNTFDLIINCIDPDPSHKLSLNKLAHKYDVAVIFMAYSYENLIIGPLIIPGMTSCYESYNKYLYELSKGAYDLRTIKRVPNSYLIHPSINYVTNFLASFVIRDIVFFLLEKTDYLYTLNTIIFFNTLDMNSNSFELSCDNCIVCQ